MSFYYKKLLRQAIRKAITPLNRLLTINKKIFSIIALSAPLSISCLIITPNSAAASWLPQNPLYVGFGVGYGSSFWSQFTAKASSFDNKLVPDDPKRLAEVSVPASASGYGAAWKILAGLYLSQHFATQFDYEMLPKTKITMNNAAMYPAKEQTFSFYSQSYRFDIIAKYLVSIFSSPYKFYADLGPNWTERDDAYTHKNHYIGAVFGLGFNASFLKRYQFDLGYQYTTGAGKASVRPLYDYMPFTGSLMLSSSLRF